MADFRIDRQKLKREIKLGIEKDPEVKLKTRKFAEEVQEHWQDVAWPESAAAGQHGADHPYESGQYVDSITVRQGRNRLGRFTAKFVVSTDDPNANFIEFGTAVDKPGSRSPWGPNTPTPEFAPAARTAHHFGGTAP